MQTCIGGNVFEMRLYMKCHEQVFGVVVFEGLSIEFESVDLDFKRFEYMERTISWLKETVLSFSELKFT